MSTPAPAVPAARNGEPSIIRIPTSLLRALIIGLVLTTFSTLGSLGLLWWQNHTTSDAFDKKDRQIQQETTEINVLIGRVNQLETQIEELIARK